MKERAAIAGALTVGILTMGGFLVLSCRRDSFAPKILGVKVVPAKSGLPPYVQIDLEPSGALLRFGRGGESWEYRVAEPGGRIYLDELNSDEHTRRLRVPYAYGRLPVSPEVQVWVEDALRGSTPIASMPPPVVSPLPTRSGGAIRAFHLPRAEAQALASGDPERRGGIVFSPTHPIPANERWIVTVLQTPAQARFDADAQAVYAIHAPRLNLGPDSSKPRSAVVRLPYAEDVRAVRVQVERILHRTRSQRVVVSGLRLVQKDGQTTLAWSGSRIPNSLGLDLHVLAASKPVRHDFGNRASFGGPGNPPRRSVDRRAPILPLSVLGDTDSRNFSKQDPYVDSGVLMAIEPPDLSRLHIRSFGFGNAYWWAKGNVFGTVDTKPFKLVLTITKQWDENLGSFEATIPVEPAPNR